MSETFQGAFLGFSFGGQHSSQFGIVRTSSGNRYEEKLLPTLTEKTTDIPGGDGMYYFGTQYKNQTLTISFAFDSLTDAQITAMKQWLGAKEVKELVLDETPYKAWDAKVTTPPSLKYLAFGNGDKRVYKGEGSIGFTMYYPFAHSRVSGVNKGLTKQGAKAIFGLDDGSSSTERFGVAYDECLLGSNIPDSNISGNKYYNYGTKEAPFILTIGTMSEGAYVVNSDGARCNFKPGANVVWNSNTGIIKQGSEIVYPVVSGGTRMTIPPNGGYIDIANMNGVVVDYKYWYC